MIFMGIDEMQYALAVTTFIVQLSPPHIKGGLLVQEPLFSQSFKDKRELYSFPVVAITGNHNLVI